MGVELHSWGQHCRYVGRTARVEAELQMWACDSREVFTTVGRTVVM